MPTDAKHSIQSLENAKMSNHVPRHDSDLSINVHRGQTRSPKRDSQTPLYANLRHYRNLITSENFQIKNLKEKPCTSNSNVDHKCPECTEENQWIQLEDVREAIGNDLEKNSGALNLQIQQNSSRSTKLDVIFPSRPARYRYFHHLENLTSHSNVDHRTEIANQPANELNFSVDARSDCLQLNLPRKLLLNDLTSPTEIDLVTSDSLGSSTSLGLLLREEMFTDHNPITIPISVLFPLSELQMRRYYAESAGKSFDGNDVIIKRAAADCVRKTMASTAKSSIVVNLPSPQVPTTATSKDTIIVENVNSESPLKLVTKITAPSQEVTDCPLPISDSSFEISPRILTHALVSDTDVSQQLSVGSLVDVALESTLNENDAKIDLDLVGSDNCSTIVSVYDPLDKALGPYSHISNKVIISTDERPIMPTTATDAKFSVARSCSSSMKNISGNRSQSLLLDSDSSPTIQLVSAAAKNVASIINTISDDCIVESFVRNDQGLLDSNNLQESFEIIPSVETTSLNLVPVDAVNIFPTASADPFGNLETNSVTDVNALYLASNEMSNSFLTVIAAEEAPFANDEIPRDSTETNVTLHRHGSPVIDVETIPSDRLTLQPTNNFQHIDREHSVAASSSKNLLSLSAEDTEHNRDSLQGSNASTSAIVDIMFTHETCSTSKFLSVAENIRPPWSTFLVNQAEGTCPESPSNNPRRLRKRRFRSADNVRDGFSHITLRDTSAYDDKSINANVHSHSLDPTIQKSRPAQGILPVRVDHNVSWFTTDSSLSSCVEDNIIDIKENVKAVSKNEISWFDSESSHNYSHNENQTKTSDQRTQFPILKMPEDKFKKPIINAAQDKLTDVLPPSQPNNLFCRTESNELSSTINSGIKDKYSSKQSPGQMVQHITLDNELNVLKDNSKTFQKEMITSILKKKSIPMYINSIHGIDDQSTRYEQVCAGDISQSTETQQHTKSVRYAPDTKPNWSDPNLSIWKLKYGSNINNDADDLYVQNSHHLKNAFQVDISEISDRLKDKLYDEGTSSEIKNNISLSESLREDTLPLPSFMNRKKIQFDAFNIHHEFKEMRIPVLQLETSRNYFDSAEQKNDRENTKEGLSDEATKIERSEEHSSCYPLTKCNNQMNIRSKSEEEISAKEGRGHVLDYTLMPHRDHLRPISPLLIFDDQSLAAEEEIIGIPTTTNTTEDIDKDEDSDFIMFTDYDHATISFSVSSYSPFDYATYSKPSLTKEIEIKKVSDLNSVTVTNDQQKHQKRANLIAESIVHSRWQVQSICKHTVTSNNTLLSSKIEVSDGSERILEVEDDFMAFTLGELTPAEKSLITHVPPSVELLIDHKGMAAVAPIQEENGLKLSTQSCEIDGSASLHNESMGKEYEVTKLTKPKKKEQSRNSSEKYDIHGWDCLHKNNNSSNKNSNDNDNNYNSNDNSSNNNDNKDDDDNDKDDGNNSNNPNNKDDDNNDIDYNGSYNNNNDSDDKDHNSSNNNNNDNKDDHNNDRDYNSSNNNNNEVLILLLNVNSASALQVA